VTVYAGSIWEHEHGSCKHPVVVNRTVIDNLLLLAPNDDPLRVETCAFLYLWFRSVPALFNTSQLEFLVVRFETLTNAQTHVTLLHFICILFRIPHAEQVRQFTPEE
jgi:hypothetical protein